jgi:hypothetical protein
MGRGQKDASQVKKRDIGKNLMGSAEGRKPAPIVLNFDAGPRRSNRQTFAYQRQDHRNTMHCNRFGLDRISV